MEKILIDSDILIDLLHNEPETASLIKQLEKNTLLGTTDVNAFELYLGAYKSRKQESEIAAAKGLIGTLFLLSTNKEAMEFAAKVFYELESKGTPIALRDLFIGSICAANSLKLLTNNKKDFKRIRGLELA